MAAENDDELDQEIFEFLKQDGQLAGTDEEVETTERLLQDRSPHVPEPLWEPRNVFEGMIAPKKSVTRDQEPTTPSEEGLARAAREGKTLSSETQRMMEDDRNKAEQDTDG